MNTPASKEDWEEINFDYNSSVLVDGFPSLLRLGELLQKNTGFKVKVEGHTDTIGDNRFNNKLGLARAGSVRDFLVKYGARAGQIEVSTRGKLEPKYSGQKTAYQRTDEARWMNRRVALTVVDDQGRTVATTTYTLTATRGTQTSTATATVTVTAPGSAPQVIAFTASPATINVGQSSSLSWQVTNADSVSITSMGTVQLTGTSPVSPTVTTTYTLTATQGTQLPRPQ